MVDFLGWMALALGGGYGIFVLTFLLSGPSIENAIQGFFLAVFFAVIWVALIAYLSPLTIGIAP